MERQPAQQMKVYLDTMIWVYSFENHPQFGSGAHALIKRLHARGDELIASLFVLSEILVVPKRNEDVFTAARLRRFFLSPAITLAPLSVDAVERYADLRALNRVKPLDAMHLAVAASVGVDSFVTADQHLHQLTVPGIRNICSMENPPT